MEDEIGSGAGDRRSRSRVLPAHPLFDCPASPPPTLNRTQYFGHLRRSPQHAGGQDLLGQTLEEEKEADEKLTGIASQINPEAENEREGEGQEEENMAFAGERSERAHSGNRGRSNSRARKRTG